MEPHPDMDSRPRGAAGLAGSVAADAPTRTRRRRLLLCAAAPASAANRWIQKRAPLNIAHQGGEDEFPSNTLYAFRKAVRAGADMLELDIGVTKDGKVIVMHDTTVDGKTNGHGTVASKTLAQIRRLDAAYWFAPAQGGPLRPRPPDLRLSPARHRHGPPPGAQGLHGRRLPRADAQPR